jgi:hypothetical protein
MRTFQIFEYPKSNTNKEFIEIQNPEINSNPEIIVCENPNRIFINTVKELKPYEIPLDVREIKPDPERCSKLFELVDSVESIRINPPSKTKHKISDSSVLSTVINGNSYSEFVFIFEVSEYIIRYNPHTIHIPDDSPTEEIINYFKWI